MAAWFRVYCSRSLGHVTAAEVLSDIGRWDFRTAAEAYGIRDDAAVDDALSSLAFELADGAGGARFRLTYGRPPRRPILAYVHSDPEVIAEAREEEEELLGVASGPWAANVRGLLARMVELAAVELGWSQLEDMGVVFAGMLAERLAVAGDGLIRDPHDCWWAMQDGVPVRIVG